MNHLLKAFLQGKWLGHPLHPILVHLPTALFPAALFFDLLSRWDRTNDALHVASWWCIAVGLLAVLAAAPTGLADWLEIKKEKPAWKLALIHAVLNVVVAVLFLLNLILRTGGADDTGAVETMPLALSLVGTVVLAYSGWLGHRIVYHHGIAIARQSKGEWRRVAEAAGARLPDAKGD